MAEGKKPVEELGISAVDKHTVKFELDSKVPYFVAMTSHTSMMPVHKATLENSDKPWSDPKQFVGNDAFVLDEWVVNERIELKKNSNYWNSSDTNLTEVTYIPFENQNASINRYAVEGSISHLMCRHTWRSNLKPDIKIRLLRDCLCCVLTTTRLIPRDHHLMMREYVKKRCLIQ